MPSSAIDNEPTRPTKRRKLGKQQSSIVPPSIIPTSRFEALLNGKESLECIYERQELYDRAWSHTEAQIQVRVAVQDEEYLAH